MGISMDSQEVSKEKKRANMMRCVGSTRTTKSGFFARKF